MGEASYSGGRLLGRVFAKIGIGPLLGIVALGAASLYVLYVREESRIAGQNQTQAKVTQEAIKAHRAACSSRMPELVAKGHQSLKDGDPDAAIKAVSECTYAVESKEANDLIASAQKAKTDLQAEIEKNQRIQDKRAAAELKAKKKREGVSIGMTGQDVLDSSWGKPQKVNRTTTALGTSEQWVYDGSYLYFENGILKTIQN